MYNSKGWAKAEGDSTDVSVFDYMPSGISSSGDNSLASTTVNDVPFYLSPNSSNEVPSMIAAPEPSMFDNSGNWLRGLEKDWGFAPATSQDINLFNAENQTNYLANQAADSGSSFDWEKTLNSIFGAGTKIATTAIAASASAKNAKKSAPSPEPP